MIKLAVAIATLACISVHALVEKRIDEKKPIEITLSRSSHNRICVEGGSVEKVIGNGSVFSITLDSSTGNAFVNVLQDMIDKPSALTVITRSGLIQDFLVLSTEGPSEQILLKENEDLEEEEANWNLLPHAATIEMLNHILEGKIPFGYGQRALTEEDQWNLPKGMNAKCLKAFEGPFESIVVYVIENDSKEFVTITCDSLQKEESKWIFLNVHELKPREQALCVVGYPKSEN